MRAAFVVVLGLAACGGDGGTDDGGGDRTDTILALTADVAAGADVFDANCSVCHGVDGTGGVGSDLTSVVQAGSEAEYVEIVLFGEDDMTPFEDVLDDQEIADVVGYIVAEFGG